MFKDDDEEEENTFGVTRYPCMPSLVALQQMRNRLHLAFLGRKLMKWTALATGRELRRLAAELYEVYQGFGEDLRNAFILLARSRYFYPQLNYIVTEDIGKKAGVVVQQSAKTVSGVKIVQFEIFETEYPPYAYLGIEKGGQTILETKKAWLDLLKRLIMMMQLRASFLMVELANKNATKKSNVLAKIVIPRLNVTSHYILSELEEKEREEVFRLKRVKQKKDLEKKLDEDRRRQVAADEGNKLKPAPSRSREQVPSRTRSKESGSLAVIKKEDN
ncbi:V-type proton ATPase subunit D-like [Vanessa tameamea]|uniref:V-type proton ATPase subunit D-like n=1 Tax=Vanessa tameamea TaxID=334116 RepID=A0A8B8HK74_VANTA|nr:V-type proton ATPase subunit D-like [Vanessa tameamea]